MGLARNVLLPILLVATCGVLSQAAATDSGDVTRGMTPEQARDPAVIRAVTQSMVTISGGVITSESSNTLTYKASGGTFLPKVARVSQQARLAGGEANAPLQRTAKNMEAVFNANSNNSGAGSLSGQQVHNALTVMTGVSATGGVAAMDGFNHAVGGSGGTIATHLAEVRNDPAVASGTASASLNWHDCSRGTANRIWGSPFYIHQDMGDKDGYQGYRYKAGGGSLGYDREVTGQITVGAAFTFAHGNYHRKGASDDNTINSYGGSAYMQYYSARSIFANIGGGYAYGRNKWNEHLGAPLGAQSGRNHSNSYWVGGMLGYDFQASCALTLTPTLGLFWSEARGSAYRSSGVFDMTVGSMRSRSLLLPVDVTLQYQRRLSDQARVTFKAGGGYSYNFKNNGSRGSISYDYVGGDAVAVSGMAPGRHGWNATAGVKYQYRNLDVGVDYRYDGRSKFTAHRVAAVVGVNF